MFQSPLYKKIFISKKLHKYEHCGRCHCLNINYDENNFLVFFSLDRNKRKNASNLYSFVTSRRRQIRHSLQSPLRIENEKENWKFNKTFLFGKFQRS